ncbi:hypothetical protein SAMN05216283_10121 [Sunxiuqinia elliptica]|uniref:Uncharacterized protein n=1 Tax=Sunxiuqinia elliptica TaxID=655355 RepID=A0A1I2A524_9BACT|nr:hypothetical protein SAMN05216283_10121 [Sunxiuqinia elliptica]
MLLKHSFTFHKTKLQEGLYSSVNPFPHIPITSTFIVKFLLRPIHS